MGKPLLGLKLPIFKTFSYQKVRKIANQLCFVIISHFWAILIGCFLGEIGQSLGGLSNALLYLAIAGLISFIYVALIIRLRRLGIGLSIGLTIGINLVNAFINPGAPIVNYIIAMTLSLHFLLFGELTLKLLQRLKPLSVYATVTGLSFGALTIGWLFAIFF